MDLMDYRRKIIENSPHLSHAEGSVATFSDGADNLPLKSLIVDIEPVQSGSGDPSPSNIRPISGWDAVGVHNGNTVVATISLGRNVYSGTLNVLTGELVVDMAKVDLGIFEWSKYSGNTNIPVFYTSTNVPNMKPGGGDFAKCSIYRCMSWTSVSRRTDKSVEIHSTIGRPYIADSAYTDARTFKSAMSGVQLVYELATPFTYHLDPQTIRSLYGQNSIWADTGNVALEYWAHP